MCVEEWGSGSGGWWWLSILTDCSPEQGRDNAAACCTQPLGTLLESSGLNEALGSSLKESGFKGGSPLQRLSELLEQTAGSEWLLCTPGAEEGVDLCRELERWESPPEKRRGCRFLEGRHPGGHWAEVQPYYFIKKRQDRTLFQ